MTYNIPEAQPDADSPGEDEERPKVPGDVPPESRPRSPTAPAVPDQPPLVPPPPVIDGAAHHCPA